MAWGVWLHLTESHKHAHTHEPLEHSHEHEHGLGDPHHDHIHDEVVTPGRNLSMTLRHLDALI